ncbi:MAG: YciI family protein [Bacteroidales bacterium]|nr:YciI family protein [Bacteroidales bacterium]
MFIFILTFLKPISEVEKYSDAHFEYLDKYYKAGNFLVSGKQNPWIGGAIICFAKDRAEAEKIASNDPFLINDIVKYDITELEATKWAPSFEKFVTNGNTL